MITGSYISAAESGEHGIEYLGGADNRLKENDKNNGLEVDGVKFKPAQFFYANANTNSNMTIAQCVSRIDLNVSNYIRFRFQHEKYKKNTFTIEQTIVGELHESRWGQFFYAMKNMQLLSYMTDAMIVGGSCMGIGFVSFPYFCSMSSGALAKFMADNSYCLKDRITRITRCMMIGSCAGLILLAGKSGRI